MAERKASPMRSPPPDLAGAPSPPSTPGTPGVSNDELLNSLQSAQVFNQLWQAVEKVRVTPSPSPRGPSSGAGGRQGRNKKLSTAQVCHESEHGLILMSAHGIART